MKDKESAWDTSSSDDEESSIKKPKRPRQSRQLLLSSSSSSGDEGQNAKKSPTTALAIHRTPKNRKRPLSRPSFSCGDLSDSSSDDSFLFRPSYTRTTATASGERNKNCFSRGQSSSGTEDKMCISKPRGKFFGSKVGERIGSYTVNDNVKRDKKYASYGNASDSDSDSDDTAELIRQLTSTSSGNKVNTGSSLPSRGCSTFPCQKTKSPPSDKLFRSKSPVDRETLDADDEASFNDDDIDAKSLTMEASNPDSKPSPQAKDDYASSNAALSSNINASARNDKLSVGFELPTQSSSSEDSSVSTEEDQLSGDDERKTAARNKSNPHVNYHSFDGQADLEDNDTGEQGKQQKLIQQHENHRMGLEEEEQFCNQTNQELFESAFGANDSGYSRTNNSGNPSRWDPTRNIRNRNQRQHHHDQPCIDLVDSDDSEQATMDKVCENKKSPRSPRKSPNFNIASRNFIYNRPWRDSDYTHQHEGVEDVIQFDDDETIVPTRPRRVTQDPSNQLSSLSDNANAAVSSYFQPRHSSNTAGQTLEPAASHRSASVSAIPRPWDSTGTRRARRMRNPQASNVSLAASVVVKDSTQTRSNVTAQSTAASSRRLREHGSDNANIGDIRTFMKRPSLAVQTRNRAKSIETVRANRHDIQGHSNITVVNHPGRETSGSRKQRTEEEDAIEVFEDPPPTKRPARRKATKAKTTKAKAKTKRKRTTTRRSRKTGGRKRKSTGNRRSGKRSINSNDDSGAWGPTGGGWASARPVHKEDPAFRNVGAEIAF